MKTTTRTTVSGLRGRLRTIRRAATPARRETVEELAGAFVGRAIVLAPRDTNRYVRAWGEAGNEAGVGAFATPPLQAAKWRETIAARLRGQLRFWEYVVNRYPPERRDKWYNRAVKKRDQLRETVLNANDHTIAIGLFNGGKARFLTKVYGGTGRVVDHGGQSVVVLHNREAHASIVEWKFGVVRKALASIRPAGGRKLWIKKKFLKAMLARGADVK